MHLDIECLHIGNYVINYIIYTEAEFYFIFEHYSSNRFYNSNPTWRINPYRFQISKPGRNIPEAISFG